MNSELLNRLPRLKKLSAAGWEGRAEESKRCCPENPGENTRAASFRLCDKMEEGRKERKRKRQTSLATPGDPGLGAE